MCSTAAKFSQRFLPREEACEACSRRVLILLAACSSGQTESASEAASNDTTMAIEDPDIEWRRLSDGSIGRFNEDEHGSDVERCWKSKDGFDCVRLARMRGNPDELQIDDPDTLAVGLKRDALRRERIMPVNGYSCHVVDGAYAYAKETLSLNNGASISNEVGSGSFGSQAFWTPDHVQKFVTENDPSTPLVFFSCAAVRDFLDQGNEAAFLTTAVNSEALGLAGR